MLADAVKLQLAISVSFCALFSVISLKTVYFLLHFPLVSEVEKPSLVCDMANPLKGEVIRLYKTVSN